MKNLKYWFTAALKLSSCILNLIGSTAYAKRRIKVTDLGIYKEVYLCFYSNSRLRWFYLTEPTSPLFYNAMN